MHIMFWILIYSIISISNIAYVHLWNSILMVVYYTVQVCYSLVILILLDI